MKDLECVIKLEIIVTCDFSFSDSPATTVDGVVHCGHATVPIRWSSWLWI